MADNKKYYYLKIKENFYETEDMKILQAMDNGYLYSDILMKLYLKSLKTNGKLMFKENIPYSPKMIATITNHNVDSVDKALCIFRELGLIEVLDNGAIYMLDIQSLIGKSSSEADRKRDYRNKIKEEKQKLIGEGDICPDIVPSFPDEHSREIELEIELELEKELELDINKITNNWNSLNLIQLSAFDKKRYEKLKLLIKEYSTENILKAIKNISKSGFLKGINENGWIIPFDWFIEPKNFIKVLEGNYADRKGANPKSKLKFDNFTGRDYDYDDLERKLLGWDKAGEDE